MNAVPRETEPYEDVILEEARRAIGTQATALDELRARTGFLLAAAAVSASFLGSATADTGVSLGFWGGLALIAFVVGIAACIVVLTPKHKAWTFVNSPKHLVAEWIEETQAGQSMQVFMAKCMEDHYDKNQEQLNGLYRWFVVAALAVGTSVVLGCIQLAVSH